MRTLIAVALLVLVTGGNALAQPGVDPQQTPQPYPQQPQPYPQQPQPYPQAGYGWQPQRPVMQYQLTVDEQYLLDRGYISDGEHIGGGLLALFIGGGLGQAVQGRWTEKGYIFTLGEAASMGLLIWGFVGLVDETCFDCTEPVNDHDATYGWMIAGGLIGYSVFHIWEIVDAFTGPSEHNRKLTQLRMRLGMGAPMYSRVTPFVVPSQAGDGALAGVALRF